MRRFLRFMTAKQPKAVLFAVVLGLMGLGVGAHPQMAHAACDASNDIMKCGFTTKPDFRTKASGSNELKHIYAAYGLEPAEYDKFVASAVQGLAYKDNTLRVGSNIVARNVDSIGRNKAVQGSGAFTQAIAGAGTYYGNTNDKAFASGPLPVTILLDAKGNVQFAVLNDCGNPVGAPNYSCNTLHESAVAGHPDTYQFSSNITANSTAKVSKVVYDFGDGTTQPETDPTFVVTHKYAKSGPYTAKVTVYISLPHATDVVIPAGGDCIKKIVVTIPPTPVYMCVSLSVTAINESHFNYKYIVTGSVANGARVHSADFDFGDKNHKNGVLASGNTVTTTHDYDNSKKDVYSVVAVLHIDLPGGKTDTVTAPKCKQKVAVNVPFYSCVGLGWTLTDEQKHTYTLAATADYQNVGLKNAQFDFGDNTSVVTVPATVGNNTISTTHSYAASGTYAISTTLNFTDGSKVVSAKCTNTITPNQITSTCQPNSPEGGGQCACASNPTLPADSPSCVTALPNTGAGDVIGIAGAIAVVGFFLYRQFIYRKHATNTVDGAALGTELVQPADDDNELTAQVITHRTAHRNAKGLHHVSYHKPHRFRPRSHKDD